MVTVKEKLADCARNVWFQNDKFSWPVKIVPRAGDTFDATFDNTFQGGGSKTIYATITIDQDPRYDDREGTITWFDLAEVSCARNPDTGIETLQLYDKIILPADIYPGETAADRCFQFFGHIKDHNTHTWIPVFERKARKTQSA